MTRLNAFLKRVMPVALDTTGIILLSSSAMLWSTIAGLAAAGVGCFVLNYRWHSGT
jgi:hypothetical protein